MSNRLRKQIYKEIIRNKNETYDLIIKQQGIMKRMNQTNCIKTNYDIRKEMGILTEDLLKEYHVKSGLGLNYDFKKFLTYNVLFMTATFSRHNVVAEKSTQGLSPLDHTLEWDNITLLDRTIVKWLYGNDWYRRKAIQHKLPLAIVGLDFEGTRYSASLDKSPKNAHFHGIFAFQPDDAAKVLKYLGLMKMKTLSNLHFDQIRFDRYDRNKSSIQDLGSYTLKAFIRSQTDPIAGEMFRIYRGFDRYKLSNRYVKINRTLNRMKDAASRDRRLEGWEDEEGTAMAVECDPFGWELIKRYPNSPGEIPF